jgi:hypothetical protein
MLLRDQSQSASSNGFGSTPQAAFKGREDASGVIKQRLGTIEARGESPPAAQTAVTVKQPTISRTANGFNEAPPSAKALSGGLRTRGLSPVESVAP